MCIRSGAWVPSATPGRRRRSNACSTWPGLASARVKQSTGSYVVRPVSGSSTRMRKSAMPRMPSWTRGIWQMTSGRRANGCADTADLGLEGPGPAGRISRIDLPCRRYSSRHSASCCRPFSRGGLRHRAERSAVVHHHRSRPSLEREVVAAVQPRRDLRGGEQRLGHLRPMGPGPTSMGPAEHLHATG